MIWVLSSSFGAGHDTAAHSVAAALRELQLDLPVKVIDLIAAVHPLLAPVLQQAYLAAIVHAPQLWAHAYDFLGRPEITTRDSFLLQPQLLYLKDKLAAQRPQAIVCTYPSYPQLFGILKAEGITLPPIITIITDKISVHPTWYAGHSDHYFVADAETATVLLQLKVPQNKVSVTGFPVSLEFTKPEPALRERVLYLPTTPTARVIETLYELLPVLSSGWGLTLLTGRHMQRLYHPLRQFLDKHSDLDIEVIGWCKNVPELLRSHRLLITKAGGAILHEAMAAAIPCIIDYVVPGQEEGNAAYLVERGVALRSLSPHETAQQVAKMLENRGRLADEMSEKMRTLATPNAARTAAATICSAM